MPIRRTFLAKVSCIILVAGAVMLACCEKKEGQEGPKLRPAEEKKRLIFSISVDQLRTPMRTHQVALLNRLIHTRAGTDVEVLDANGDAAEQIKQMETAVEQGSDFLMVFPGDPQALAPALKAAMGKGVKVFAFSGDLPADACTTQVYCDPRTLGKMAGDFIVEALKTKAAASGQAEATGRVVQIRGEERDRYSDRITEGLTQSLKQTPGVVLVHDAPGDWIEKSAGERLNEAFAVQKTFDVIFAQNDLMALGASQAASALGGETRESMLILGLDGVSAKGAGMEMVNSGEVDATIYQPPLVDYAWSLANRMLDDPDFTPKELYVIKPFVIGPDNVAAMLRKILPDPEVE